MSTINRKAHCLKREKTLAMPRHLIFFDVETKPEYLDDGRIVQRLKLGWACYVRRSYARNLEKSEWCYFETAEVFWQFVFSHTEHKRKLWVLARSLVFDFTNVAGFGFLRREGFKLKFFHSSGSTSIISVRSRAGSIVFLDIMNWFVESLARTGERIGIPKLQIDFETCSDEYLKIYCRRDVEIEVENFRRFIKFLEAYSISRLCYTRGSTAMAAYLFRHYKKRIYIHNNKEAIDLERDSYRGGRTECFRLGVFENETYYSVDVNSLYPFVMRNKLYPVRYLEINSRPDIKALDIALKDRAVIAKVFIDTDEPVYAVRRKRTIFPIGRFWVCLTTPELKYARAHDHVLAVESMVVYVQADIFSTYVDSFYALRQEFKSAHVSEYEELCKKMLNSLYGKFGQKADVWEKIGDCPDEPDRVEICFNSVNGRVSQIRYLLGEVFELTGYKESFNSFPGIASHVAAYARMTLYELMRAAGSGNYLYCDTDSLFVNKRGLTRLATFLDDTRLGALKIQDQTTSLIIRGVKDYTFGGREVIKGIRKNAERIAEGLYSQELWPSFKGLLRRGETDTYTISRVTKQLTRKYTKGTINEDSSISPLILDEPFDCDLLFR